MGKMREELWRLVDRATARQVEVRGWPAVSVSTLSANRGQRRRQFRDFIKKARRASLDADIARMREERSKRLTSPAPGVLVPTGPVRAAKSVRRPAPPYGHLSGELSKDRAVRQWAREKLLREP